MIQLIFLSILSLTFQSQWETYLSYDGRFSVAVPGILQEKIDSVQTDLGKMAYHTFFLQQETETADNHVYMVNYCDYPEGIVFADSSGLVADFFRHTMEAAAESVNGEVLYSSDLELNGYPGKLWRIDYLDGNAVIKTKAYLIENRYYAIQTISGKDKNLNLSTERFFDSFKLL